MKNTPKTQKLIDAIKIDLDAGTLSQRKIGTKHGVSQGFVHNVKFGTAKPLIIDSKIAPPKADPTNEKILQLEAQVVSLNDERRRLSKAYKAAQRENSVFEALVDEMEGSIEPIKPLPKALKRGKNGKQIRESVVMHLTDEHADSLVLPHCVDNLERFDFGIALRRAEQYVDTVIKFTQKTLACYNFHTLWIFAHGDHTSGEIHGAVEHSYYRNQFRNCLAVGQMHALMFRDLAHFFPQIHVLYLSGNHGRRTSKKDYKSPWNNWDYLVAEIAKQHCANLGNVDFLIPDSFSANVDVEGHGFCVSHGDDIRSWNSMPWYGIERKVRRWSALNAAVDRKINYFCFGHFHNAAILTNLNGEVIINGSWIATDPYAVNAITAFTEPTQLIHGVHKDHGVSWRLHVKLRTGREHLGPNRYSVLLAKP